MDNNDTVPTEPNTNDSIEISTPEIPKAEESPVEVPAPASKPVEDPIADALDTSVDNSSEPEAPSLNLTSETPAPVAESAQSSSSTSTTESAAAPTPSAPSDAVAPTVANDVKPTDVTKKKMPTVAKVFLIIGIVSGVIALGIVAVFVILASLKVDYQSAYQSVQKIQDPVSNIRLDNNCGYAVEYVTSGYTTNKDYEKYTTKCVEVYSALTSDMIDELGATSGVMKDDEIKAKYDEFKMNYDALASKTVDFEAKLELYTAYHKFVNATYNFSFDNTTETEAKKSASYLTESNNETLSTYGAAWLEKATDAIKKTSAWRSSNNYFSDEYNQKNDAQKAYNTYVRENKPDMETIAELDFSGVEKLYSSFKALFNMISDKYEENYKTGSYDCDEFGSSVSCENLN